jgi:UPF0716 protein FxsA
MGSMLAKLLLIFITVPLLEIMLFIEIGSRIGTLMTLLIVALTAILGATLAHREGLKAWWRIQDKLYQGEMPNAELLDGVLILIAGAVLLTPGFLTDAIGFVLLYPGTRQPVKSWLRHKFSQRYQIHYRK